MVSNQIENISSLAMFICIFYVRAWLTCTSAVDAPANNLLLLKSLLQTEKQAIRYPQK